MSRTPSYRAWYPVLRRKGADASIILTPGSSSRAPAGGRAFFENLMETVAVSGQLVAWGTHPFVSSYFSDDTWQESWDAILVLEDGVLDRRDDVVAGVDILAHPESEESPSQYVPVRVFADFTNRKDAEACRATLMKRADDAAWDEIHYEGYTIRDVGPRLKQLTVTVSTADRADLHPILDEATTVRTICADHGGRTAPA